jgi:hypothetical protein
MTEWRLFPEGTIPDFTTVEFFEKHPWIAPAHQMGHRERTAMVATLIREFIADHPVGSISDLGCGDGSLLASISDLPLSAWGYDAGKANVDQARSHGLDVRHANLMSPGLEYGELITASEVVEHLVDPHGFIAGLPGRALILSSPSAEDGDWHYEHHSWAWDMEGYAALVTGAGWTIIRHVECDAPDNFHGGVQRPQRFQALAAIK